MSGTFEINAVVREEHGKGASRRLRREQKVPAVIYGGTDKPQSLSLELRELVKALENEAFYSHILDVKIGDKTEKAIIMDLQRHPATGVPMHIDFERVSKSTIIHKRIPLHFINEEVVAKTGAKVQHVASEVEVTCSADNLPEFIEVDVAKLTAGSIVHLSELSLPEGVTLVELNKGESHDAPVVSVVSANAGADEAEETEEASE